MVPEILACMLPVTDAAIGADLRFDCICARKPTWSHDEHDAIPRSRIWKLMSALSALSTPHVIRESTREL